MLGDIDLIFGILMYNDELQIKFTFRSGPMIFGRVMALGCNGVLNDFCFKGIQISVNRR
jgi:hypothetical protein